MTTLSIDSQPPQQPLVWRRFAPMFLALGCLAVAVTTSVVSSVGNHPERVRREPAPRPRRGRPGRRSGRCRLRLVL